MAADKVQPPTRFPSAAEDVQRFRNSHLATPQSSSPAYRLAYADADFILTDEMRPVRLLLELSKPELTLQQHNIHHTIVIFGSARILDPDTAANNLSAVDEKLRLQPADSLLLTARQKAILRTWTNHAITVKPGAWQRKLPASPAPTICRACISSLAADPVLWRRPTAVPPTPVVNPSA